MRTNFSPNGKGTGGGSVPFAGGDSVGGDLLITVEDVYLLSSQIDLNSAIGVGVEGTMVESPRTDRSIGS